MPRRTIYIPHHLALELRTLPGEMNVSQVCADALRAEVAARGVDRSAAGLFSGIGRNPTRIEEGLMHKFRLRRVLIGDDRNESLHDSIGYWTSNFLDRAFYEGLTVAMGGGTQMWEVARRLQPRNLGLRLWAIGFGHVDYEMPYVHPNALVTLLSMLYASRTRTMLVGAPDFARTWHWPATFKPGEESVRRLVVGSCGMFDAESSYARMLGKEITDFLMDENIMGDFLGVFIKADGSIIEPYAPSMTVSHISAVDLFALAKGNDAMVLLAAAGGAKLKLIRQVLEAGLCNALITDGKTALALL
jgi:DNA-binding transcriptional regulator LsrR (DeoR family)